MTPTDLYLFRDRIPEKLIIVLAKEPDMNSHVLDLQNYVMDGENVIPIFSSQAAMANSLRGSNLGRPMMSISRALLVSVLHGNEVFLLDPQLPSQLRFTAAEFREAFPESFTIPVAYAMSFIVEDVFYIKPPVDRVIVCGTVKNGIARVGDNLLVHGFGGPISVTVDNIESFQGDLKEASKGQQVGLRLTGIRKDQVCKGDRVTSAK